MGLVQIAELVNEPEKAIAFCSSENIPLWLNGNGRHFLSGSLSFRYMEVYGLNELQAVLELTLRQLIVPCDLVAKLDCTVNRLIVVGSLLRPASYGLLDGELLGGGDRVLLGQIVPT